MHLLALGKTVEDVTDGSRYRMADPGTLPRFAGARKPEGEGQREAAAGAGGEDPANLAAATAAPQTRAETMSAQTAAADGNGQSRRWFLGRRNGTRRELDRGPVQRELALGAVTVVRNDLVDSDLEVVPAGKPALAPAQPLQLEPALVSTPPTPGFWRGWWSRVWGRFARRPV
jgi:hypothetical protein